MPGKRSAGSRTLDERTTYRFSILASRQTRCLSAMYIQKFGLSVSQWKVLPIVGYHGPMSAKDVGERTSLEPEKVTRAVDQLVDRAFVTRRSDPKDRRRVVLSLTAKGREVFRESEQLRGVIEAEFLDALRPKERLLFHRLLCKLERRAALMFDDRQSWRKIVGDRDLSHESQAARRRSRGSKAAV
jgi:DNA-binding MarR family transcriptional regulator